jgi:signal transduction histidine kinase
MPGFFGVEAVRMALLSAGVYRSILLAFLIASFACSASTAAEPKRVMLLHSFGRDFKPWSDYSRAIREELARQTPWPLDVLDQLLASARVTDETPEGPFIDYLGQLYANTPLDLIITIGGPAANFVQRNRNKLFPGTPVLMAAVNQYRIDASALTDNDTVVAVNNDYLAVFESMLQVLPETKTVMVVIGNSPLEQRLREQTQRDLKSLEGRIKLRHTNDLSFEELLRSAATLPPHSAIFWHALVVDGAGFGHEGDTSLARVHEVANAPMFSYDDSFFGHLLGGPMQSVAAVSGRTASVAIRLLGGEKAGNIKTPVSEFATPKYDWRELQRWGISESRLPSGSDVHFQAPTFWDQYREQTLAIFAALLLQSALIFWLAYEHRRRHLAEVTSRNSMAELTAMNRRAAAGELSASIAHEVNQPLAGITTSAAAALRWLAAEPPNNEKARAAMRHVVEAGHRAADVITNIRAMFAKDTNERSTIEINSLLMAVLAILRLDLQKNGIEVQAQLDDRLPVVEGNKVQLQQVILNLIMNAMEAMHATQPRILKVRSERRKPELVHVSISDSGAGIDPANIDRVFGALFTTKERGMGMGLSICKSIIENHNGRIWVSAGSVRGTTFNFELPTKAAGKAKAAESVVENA